MNSLTPEEREAFAKKAETSVGYINLLSCGARNASPKLAKRLQDASDGKVTIYDLRPDVYDIPEVRCGRRVKPDRRSKDRK
jgi:DNA-binding transcriptional regulator YdaS (Cro superfamily)